MERRSNDWGKVQREVEDAEARLEKFAMGQEYDSGKVGKGDMEPSQWMLQLESYWHW